MGHVLVPPEGSRFAEAILADARLFAGPSALMVLPHTSISGSTHRQHGRIPFGIVSHLHCAVIVVPVTALESTHSSLELAAMPLGVS